MINLNELKTDLQKSVDYYQDRLKQLRTGRAKADMFSSLSVSAYDMENQMQSVASVTVDGPTSVVITPYDPNLVNNIVKAIEDANMGYAPRREENRVRINIPALTGETRAQIVKEMYLTQEEVKVTIRQIRHKYMEAIDKEEGVSEDDQKRDRATVQKLVDETNTKLEEMSAAKEQDIMTV